LRFGQHRANINHLVATYRVAKSMHITSSPYARSAISNGKRSHRTRAQGGIDGRTRQARRWRDTYGSLVRELGHDPGVAEDVLVRSACDLIVACDHLSEDIASGRKAGAEDLDRLNRLNGSLRHTLRQLGLGGGGPTESDADQLRRRREDLEAGLT
jgi:hypothetical protein